MSGSSSRPSGTTAELLQLCGGYFGAYVFTGVLVKYFTTVRAERMSDIAYLFNNTLGGTLLALAIVLALRWPRHLASLRSASWGALRFPAELLWIEPSGICTAVVIPTTTLLYTLPISVMVAMVIMRGSIIVVSRLVDELQIRQGVLDKRVYHEENLAVVFAILAVATNVLLAPLGAWIAARGVTLPAWLNVSTKGLGGSFDFFHSTLAMTILGLYIGAYAIRIYIMNYYKNTRAKGVKLDNRGFFAVEQIAASATMVAIGALVCLAPALWGATDPRVVEFGKAVRAPSLAGILSGLPYGIVAFFSVFIFMFAGRTATFAGLVNRLTSLLAGVAATLLAHFVFGLKLPSAEDWMSVAFILVAVYFLTRAEQRRTKELGLAMRIDTAAVAVAGAAAVPSPAVAAVPVPRRR